MVSKMTDNAAYKQMRTRQRRGLTQMILALKHVDYREASEKNLYLIEHIVGGLEYFDNLGRDIADMENRFKRYRKNDWRRVKTIRKLRAKRVEYNTGLPEEFFRDENGETPA